MPNHPKHHHPKADPDQPVEPPTQDKQPAGPVGPVGHPGPPGTPGEPSVEVLSEPEPERKMKTGQAAEPMPDDEL